jgi:peptidoglycan/xylan/chitin deacetylase (PgdA/CDA1 family)
MTILCYHSVRAGWQSPMAVEPDDFERHCAWLQAHRAVIPLAQAVHYLDGRGRLPRGTAVLTFDDGFDDLYVNVLPVLKRRHLPATVFVVAATLTDHGYPVNWVDTVGDQRLTTLTREQVLEMQEAGVDFQSHTWAHRDLTQLEESECVRDLRDSREFLADLLARPVTQLAYPRGRHNKRVRGAASRAGYTYAFALPERPEQPGPLAVPRVGIHRGNSVRTLSMKSSRAYLRLRTGRAYPMLRRMANTPSR